MLGLVSVRKDQGHSVRSTCRRSDKSRTQSRSWSGVDLLDVPSCVCTVKRRWTRVVGRATHLCHLGSSEIESSQTGKDEGGLPSEFLRVVPTGPWVH